VDAGVAVLAGMQLPDPAASSCAVDADGNELHAAKPSANVAVPQAIEAHRRADVMCVTA
jgi:hypothetical protein